MLEMTDTVLSCPKLACFCMIYFNQNLDNELFITNCSLQSPLLVIFLYTNTFSTYDEMSTPLIHILDNIFFMSDIFIFYIRLIT